MKIKQLLLPIITASLLLIGVSAFKQTQISETRAARIDGDIDYVHSVKLTDESKTWKDGDTFTLADLTVDLTMYGYGRETHTADKIGYCTDGQYKCSFSDESLITSITLSEGLNKLTLHFLLGGFNCYGDFDKQVDVVASAATFTAEDLAKEFNGAMELNCDSNGNTSAANLANIKTAWETAAKQYQSLDSDEKAKFSGSSSGSPADIITDLTGYTWIGNDFIDAPPYEDCSINFTSNGENYYKIGSLGGGNDYTPVAYLINGYEGVVVWNGDLQNPNYKAIQITGGNDVQNSNLITWFQANGTLSKTITDLTGYTWVGNDDMEYPEDHSYFINFESNKEDFNEFQFDCGNDSLIGYLNRDESLYEFPYFFYFDEKWQNEAYRTINILGGTDATNVNLITWFQANGTLSKTITDLTGYTWVGNDFIEGPPYEVCSINFTSNGENYYKIGSIGGGNDYCPVSYLINDYEGVTVWNGDLQNENYKTIQITGGNDVQDSNLIAWLQANGTLSKSINPDIVHMLLKYDYIYTKYGESLELENFLQRDLAPLSVKINNFNFGDKSESIWIVAVVAIAGLTAIGGCFFYRKRKQY